MILRLLGTPPRVSTAGSMTVGAWLTKAIGPDAMRWILGVSFIAMAAWMLIPDKLDDDDAAARKVGGVFVSTTVLFFLVEIGDKTQVATVALAARFQDVLLVAAGTTAGMMIANAPVVFIGEAAATKLPLKWIRLAAAASFAAIGVWILLS